MHGPWPMGHGPWSMVHGVWSMDHGPWYMNHGPWYLDLCPWTMVHGSWTMGRGPWASDHTHGHGHGHGTGHVHGHGHDHGFFPQIVLFPPKSLFSKPITSAREHQQCFGLQFSDVGISYGNFLDPYKIMGPDGGQINPVTGGPKWCGKISFRKKS